MGQKLQVKEHPRVDRDNRPRKVRKLNQVSADLWTLLRELCNGEHKWPLFLYGRSGTGKSCAALCLVDRVDRAEFWSMPALDRQVQEVKRGTAEWTHLGHGTTWTTKTWWDHMSNLSLLVLDDVGLPEMSSDSQAETLFMALEARDGRPLICTSNLDENGIATTYNTRIRSRMCSGTIYNLTGDDRRYESQESPEYIA